MLPHNNKIVGVFDRDRVDTIGEIGELKDYGNNVYAFCIPVPESRMQYNKISIEFYYEDRNLQKLSPEGNRLYFTNEFYFDENRRVIRKRTAEEITDDADKQIYDKDIGEIEGVCSKTQFAELVQNNDEYIVDFNFENFRLIINKIKEILQIDSNQSN